MVGATAAGRTSRLDQREGALADQRTRLVAETAAVRRTATVALVAISVIVAGGGLLIALLVHAEQQVSHLSELTQEWQRTVTAIEGRAQPMLEPGYRAAAPPQLLRTSAADVADLLDRQVTQSRALDDAVADLRSAPTSLVSFLDPGSLAEYTSNRLNPSFLATISTLPAKIAARPDAPLSTSEVQLRNAIQSDEFSGPADLRTLLVRQMLAESRTNFRRWITALFALIPLTAVGVWLVVLWPALTALRELTTALGDHASELTHSYLTLSAAQELADLGYWVRRGSDSSLECSPELTSLISRSGDTAPTTLAELARLSHGDAATMALARYERLGSTDGESEFTRTIDVGGGGSTIVRERIQSTEVDGQHELIGVMLYVSDITSAQQVIHRMEQLALVEMLISGVAHDFNNLLAVMLGNAELAKRKGDSAQPQLANIATACETATSLIEQLRSTALDPGPADDLCAADSVRRVAAAVRPPEGVTLSVEVEDTAEQARIVANSGLFENAIVNVVENAFDAVRRRGGHVTLGVAAVDDVRHEHSDRPKVIDSGTRLVTITVRDDGDGMSESVRRRATQPFFTTKSAIGRGNAGLGLWSVYAFTTTWGGDLVIDTEPGAGTSVSLAFPESAAVMPVDVATDITDSRLARDERTATLPPTSAVADGRGRTVLLVEDDDGLRSVQQMTLRSEGYNVVACRGYDDALARLEEVDDIGVLVSDIHLGDGPSGVEVAAAAAHRRPSIAIVLISGAHRIDELPELARDVEFTFLAKPHTTAGLVAAIDGAMGAAARRRGERAPRLRADGREPAP